MTTEIGVRAIELGRRRVVWWDGALWWRTYQVGGFDGYRTLRRRLACGALAQRMSTNSEGGSVEGSAEDATHVGDVPMLCRRCGARVDEMVGTVPPGGTATNRPCGHKAGITMSERAGEGGS